MTPQKVARPFRILPVTLRVWAGKEPLHTGTAHDGFDAGRIKQALSTRHMRAIVWQH